MARISMPASAATYTKGRGGKSVRYIVVHYTGAAGSARNNGTYFAGGNRNASAHYFIDDADTVLSVPLDSTAWHAGNFAFNQASVGIEVCSAGEDFSDGEVWQLRTLVMELMQAYGVAPANVVRHHDAYAFGRRDGVGGSWIDPGKMCPAPYCDDAKWQPLWAYITGTTDTYGGVSAPTDGGEDAGGEPTGALTVDGYWGSATTAALQRALECVADGEMWHQWRANVDASPALTSGWQCDETREGSPVIRALQARLAMDEDARDGIWGPETCRALQQAMGTVVDGHLDAPSPCVRALQARLNAGAL